MNLQSAESNTLSAVRGWIGQVQRSETSISIQHTVVRVDQHNVLTFTTLGLGAITSAFEEAAMLYTWTNGYLGKKNLKIAQQALAFIQGTSLEIAIKIYGVDYDAEALRNTFFRMFHVKQDT